MNKHAIVHALGQVECDVIEMLGCVYRAQGGDPYAATDAQALVRRIVAATTAAQDHVQAPAVRFAVMPDQQRSGQ